MMRATRVPVEELVRPIALRMK